MDCRHSLTDCHCHCQRDGTQRSMVQQFACVFIFVSLSCEGPRVFFACEQVQSLTEQLKRVQASKGSKAEAEARAAKAEAACEHAGADAEKVGQWGRRGGEAWPRHMAVVGDWGVGGVRVAR